MDWAQGLHNIGVALILIGAIGLVATLAYYLDADLNGHTANKNHAAITAAALLAALLAGAFTTGAWA